jgi:ribosomal protein S18
MAGSRRRTYQRNARDVSIQFSRHDGSGYSSWDYTLDLTIVCTATPSFTPITLPNDLAARQLFQYAADDARNRRYEGAYPVFDSVRVGLTDYSTRVFLRAFENMEGRIKPRKDAALERVSQHSLVQHDELGGPPLDDFRAMMRATSQYCQSHGGVGGFPTFQNASFFPVGTLCGIMILYSAGAVWRAIRLADLGSPAATDIAARFVAVHDYAIRHGFVAGFPDYNDTEWGNGVVQCGVVLINDRSGQVINPL